VCVCVHTCVIVCELETSTMGSLGLSCVDVSQKK